MVDDRQSHRVHVGGRRLAAHLRRLSQRRFGDAFDDRQFEVETVVASLDRSHLLYATNEGAIDERHILSVGLDGRPKAMTHRPWQSVVPHGAGKRRLRPTSTHGMRRHRS